MTGCGPRGGEDDLRGSSLLLDYLYLPPVLATYRAPMAGGDWAVALTSATQALLALPIPALAGGIFWAQWYPAIVAGCAHHRAPAGAHRAVGAARRCTPARTRRTWSPAGRRRCAHPAKSLAELLSWLYMSPLLVDRAASRRRGRGASMARHAGGAGRRARAHRREKQRRAGAEMAATPPPPVPPVWAVEPEHDDADDDDQHSRLPAHLAAATSGEEAGAVVAAAAAADQRHGAAVAGGGAGVSRGEVRVWGVRWEGWDGASGD